MPSITAPVTATRPTVTATRCILIMVGTPRRWWSGPARRRLRCRGAPDGRGLTRRRVEREVVLERVLQADVVHAVVVVEVVAMRPHQLDARHDVLRGIEQQV